MQPTLVFQSAGEGEINVQYSDTLQNSAMTLDGNLLEPPTGNFMNFTGGATGLAANTRAIAMGSGAVIAIVAVVVTAGTLGDSTARGVIFFNKVSGTIASGDTFTYFTMQGLPQTCPMNPAKSVSVSCETNAMRFTVSGVAPTNSAGTPANFGQALPANANMTIAGWSSVKMFSWIAAVSGSSPLLNVGINF
jgi:hypothetical protein